MKKVMSVMITGVTVAHGDDEDPVSLERDGHGINSLPVPSNLSSVVWDRMVSKAKTVVSDSASMSPIPGSSSKSRFVVSFRNCNSPMKVQAGKSPGQYTCDKKKWPAYAGYNICSHVLAVAMQNSECEDLLQ